MTLISLIAAVDEQGGIGRENKLLCHLPADLKHFKSLTINKPVIMGRKTYESIGRALPERLNIVLSTQPLSIDGAIVASSLEEALALTKDKPEIMIIGGAAIFHQALPIAHRIYLTVIHGTFEADVFFPVIDKNIWSCKTISNQSMDEKNNYDMTFYCYERHIVNQQL